MVQCEVCAGWFHLECLRTKEGVRVLDGRVFVCCFCLSVKVLIGELWGEMTCLCMEVLRKENDDLMETTIGVEGT